MSNEELQRIRWLKPCSGIPVIEKRAAVLVQHSKNSFVYEVESERASLCH